MKELRNNQRVVFYEQGHRIIGTVMGEDLSGDSSLIIMQEGVGITWRVHRKQVRLLTKKKRREFWVSTMQAFGVSGIFTKAPEPHNEQFFIHVREVKKK